MSGVPGWTTDGGALQRTFRFADYRATIAFANAVAQIAEQHDHHPELLVGYATCRVTWTTHSAGNTVTDKDLLCAAKANALYHPPENA